MDEYLSDASGSSKIREFIVDCGLEALYLAPYISTRPGAKLDNLLSLVDGLSFAEPTNAMRVRLAKHYDQMATALRL
jgi:hypothetical protein